MKPKSSSFLAASLLVSALAAPLHADPEYFLDGIYLDDDDSVFEWGTSSVVGWNSSPSPGITRHNLQLGANAGSVGMFSGKAFTNRVEQDGGVWLWGNSVSVILSQAESPSEPLSFEVWEYTAWANTSTGMPLFKVDAVSGDSTFTNSDVAVNGGTLKVDGNAVLTASNLGTALNAMGSPPNSSAWTAVYTPRGTVSGGASLALGTSTASGSNAVSFGISDASGISAFASGYNTTASGNYSSAFGGTSVASGDHSFAIGSAQATGSSSFAAGGSSTTATNNSSFAFGVSAYATGDSSVAFGRNSTASGTYAISSGFNATAAGPNSFAKGSFLAANTIHESVFGRYNTASTANTSWAGEDALFRLGNGSGSTDRSDALATLKNGKTTLVNKAWKAAVTADPDDTLEDPSATDDSNGEALVVEGHTRLKGKVVIEAPQGGVSMGIYD